MLLSRIFIKSSRYYRMMLVVLLSSTVQYGVDNRSRVRSQTSPNSQSFADFDKTDHQFSIFRATSSCNIPFNCSTKSLFYDHAIVFRRNTKAVVEKYASQCRLSF